MEKFGKSQTVKRREDVRFLAGAGRYVDDIAPAGALRACFLRSQVAHAEIVALDLERARAAAGVHLVLGVDDLAAAGIDPDMHGAPVKNRDGSMGANPARPVLARDRLRFVGEAIAVVVAGTLDQARDAVELIEVDYTELPAHVTPKPGGESIHPEAPENIAYDWAWGDKSATDAAFSAARHRVALEVVNNRIIANSIEPRGCFAEWDGSRLHLAVNGQGVWGQKAELVRAMGLAPGAVRVTNPDVGGGFGMKAMAYPESVVVATAARLLGQPVHWISERTEAMLSDNAGRDLVSNCELAFDENLRITAYRVNTISNLGAYNSQFAQAIQSDLFARVLTGAYDVQTIWHEVKGVYTNTTQVDAYRGAGRPEAIYALERAIDNAARTLGFDQWEFGC
ncbi:MAG: xanthine dehydrogenase family protein molybdopterin-binding subunit, partial [Halocynthiibacter sp.]